MNLFDLYAKITIDTSEYEKGIGNASATTSTLSSKLKTGLATAAKVGAAAVTAAATAVTALTKASIEGYAEYEQLVGGVETLFKTSADVVQDYASNAYKTAGLSANDYMETVTSFSASLLQSLDNDTAAAARYADLAITDMSDNANKMGTSMESIQNAYQGFAKQNYTMLDNLKLGYGGTKAEMERLIADANAIKVAQGELGDLTIDSYADIVDAIHTVQTEMGITGTTALEASTTIQGSISSMKAAWSNLVVGIADDNADMDALIGNFVESVGIAAKNILPRIATILSGIGKMVEQLGPIVSEAIPALTTQVIPSMLSAGVALLQSLLDGISSNIGQIASSASEIALMLIRGLIAMVPDIISTGAELVVELINGISSDPESLISTAVSLVVALVSGLISAAPQIISAGFTLISALLEGIISNFPELVSAGIGIIGKVLEGLNSTLSEIVSGGGKIVDALKEGISNAWDTLVSWFKGVWDSLFGNLTVNVTASGGETSGNSRGRGSSGTSYTTARGRPVGRYATGLDYVPFDEFPAFLHKGEMVVPAEEAELLRQGIAGGKVVNLTINSPQLSKSDLDYILQTVNRELGSLA